MSYTHIIIYTSPLSSIHTPSNVHNIKRKETLVPRQLGAALARWRAEPRGGKHLLHAILLLLELVVDLVEVLERDAVADHLERVDLPVLDHLEERLPVEVHGCLAVADEADAALHERADVEVVAL